MPPVHSPSARMRLLSAAEELLRESGMAGTGIKDVVARSRTPLGSLYHYFPEGKTQLVAESLRIHADRVPRLLERFFDGKKSAAAALRALFNTAAEGFERGGANKGCAIGAVTLDLMRQDTEIRNVCSQAFDRWIALIARQLSLSDEPSRRCLAVMIVAALEGAFVLAKAAQSGQAFRDVGECLSAMVSCDSRDGLGRPWAQPKSRSRP